MDNPHGMLDSVQKARRIVVKIGTHVVTDGNGEFALGRVHGLLESLIRLRREHKQILLVSSGAVGLGAEVLGLESRPKGLGLRQACAAAGQGRLISVYERALALFGIPVAQVLLSQDDLADPDRTLCLRTTLLRLLEHGAIPVINENDSVSVRELIERRIDHTDGPPSAFGDNDELSARLAVAVDADLLVLLTDVDGLHTANPKSDSAARRIASVAADEPLADPKLADTSGTSLGGTGGMQGKLLAAAIAREAGIHVWLADGTRLGVLDAMQRGEDLGTRIPAASRRSAKRRSIAVHQTCAGSLTINDGAATALRESKASLLPVGIIAVLGRFPAGAVVEILDQDARQIGRGQVNYSAEQIQKIAGCRSAQILERLGWVGYDAVINRQNMVTAELAAVETETEGPRAKTHS